MAWTTPGTATAGEVLTAAFWNTNVRDNLNDLDQNTAQLIETVTLTGDAVISFSSIPQTYTSLKIVMTARSNVAAVFTAVGVRFNDDNANNYNIQGIQVNNTTVTGILTAGGNNLQTIVIPGATATAGIFGACEITIPAYRGSTVKSVVGFGSSVSATAANSYMRYGSGYWNNTAAITKIAFSETMVSGTKATLIGIP